MFGVGSLCATQYAQNQKNELQQIIDTGGATFYKDYQSPGIQADYSVGDGTATFTRTASTCTYIDLSGVIQTVTAADIPRFAGGYYDETGFHSAKGLMVEAAGTNLLVRTDGTASGSGLWTGWTEANDTGTAATLSQVTCPTLSSIGGASAQRVQLSGQTSTNKVCRIESTSTAAGTVVQNDVVTVSFWARSQTGNGVDFGVWVRSRNAADAALSNYTSSAFTLSTSWKYFSYAATITDATSSRVRVNIGCHSGVDTGDILDYEFYGVQLEKSPYATSFIPTTSAALTRNAETLKYAIAGNRTAATESIAIKFMPLGGSFANDGVERDLSATQTKNRVIQKAQTNAVTSCFPNSDDSGVVKNTTTSFAVNTSYVLANTMQSTGNPNFQVFVNGVQENTDSNTDFTANAWGVNFSLGSTIAGGTQMNGLLQKVCFFNRILSSGEVSANANLLNS